MPCNRSGEYSSCPRAAVQVFSALPAVEFAGAASGALADGGGDVRTLRGLAAMRGIEWDGNAGGAASAGGAEQSAGASVAEAEQQQSGG